MEKVKNKFGLRHAKSDVVLVETLNKVFVREGGDWVEKLYWTTSEVSAEIGMNKQTVREWAIKLRLGSQRTRNFRFSLRDIIELRCRA